MGTLACVHARPECACLVVRLRASVCDHACIRAQAPVQQELLVLHAVCWMGGLKGVGPRFPLAPLW